MPGVWETAEMLIAMAGDGDAAVAVARGLAEDSRKGRRAREAAFWRDVVVAVLWLANPQPLIAARMGPGQGAAPASTPRRAGATDRKTQRGATIHRLHFVERLPRERQRLARIKKKLRAILDRRRGEGPPKKPNGDG